MKRMQGALWALFVFLLWLASPIGAAPLVNLANQVKGVLSKANGGTGASSFSAAGIPVVVCTGTVTLTTSSISSGATTSAVTASCPGATTSMQLLIDYTTDLTGVTGYESSTSGILAIFKYISSDQVNLKVENNTGSALAPGSVTIQYTVLNPAP